MRYIVFVRGLWYLIGQVSTDWNQNQYKINRNVQYPGYDVPAQEEPGSTVKGMWDQNQKTLVLSTQESGTVVLGTQEPRTVLLGTRNQEPWCPICQGIYGNQLLVVS